MVGEVKMAKRKKKKTLRKLIYVFILTLALGGCYLYYNHQHQLAVLQEQQRLEEERIKKEKEEKYQTCLTKKYEESELTNELLSKKNEIDTYIKTNNYKASVLYEDIQTGFNYKYNTDTVYYGCSLIKIVDALYLINQAILGNVNLDTETVTYTRNYVRSFSSGMEKRKIGEQVSLRDLITYAISVSDNSAHMMLFDFIGLEKIREFANSINVKTSISYSDKFGNLRAIDGYNILKEAYRILSLHNEYSEFLEKIMHNEYYNYLNFDDVEFLHKYGYSDRYYNDIGIYNGENPYLISVFTRYAYDDYQNIVKTLSKKIYNIYEQNFNEKKEYCNTQKENVTEN